MSDIQCPYCDAPQEVCHDDGAVSDVVQSLIDGVAAKAPAAVEPVACELIQDLDELSSELHYEGNCEMSQQKQDRAELINRGVQALKAALTAQAPAGWVPSREDFDLCRQWFDSVQDTNGGYLNKADYVLAAKLYKHLEMRIPSSIAGPAALPQPPQPQSGEQQ